MSCLGWPLETERKICCNLQFLRGMPQRRYRFARKLGIRYVGSGGMGEWLIPAVLKTVDGETRPGVRIPLPPPKLCFFWPLPSQCPVEMSDRGALWEAGQRTNANAPKRARPVGRAEDSYRQTDHAETTSSLFEPPDPASVGLIPSTAWCTSPRSNPDSKEKGRQPNALLGTLCWEGGAGCY